MEFHLSEGMATSLAARTLQDTLHVAWAFNMFIFRHQVTPISHLPKCHFKIMWAAVTASLYTGS